MKSWMLLIFSALILFSSLLSLSSRSLSTGYYSEEEIQTKTIVTQETVSPDSKPVLEWLSYLLIILVAIWEVVSRRWPTSRSLSLITLLIRIIQVILPDRLSKFDIRSSTINDHSQSPNYSFSNIFGWKRKIEKSKIIR